MIIEHGQVIAATKFLDMDTTKIVLQCLNPQVVPYIKRSIIAIMGEPDNDISNVLKYNFYRIAIVPLNHDVPIGWSDMTNTFYITSSKTDDYAVTKCGVEHDDFPQYHLRLMFKLNIHIKDIIQVMADMGYRLITTPA